MVDRRAFDLEQQSPVPQSDAARQRLADAELAIGTVGTVTIPAMVHDNLDIYGYTNGNGDNAPAVAPPFSNLGLDPTASQADRENLIIAQEWWARYDRQRLARDIYVLLYTLGLGNGDESVRLS